MEFDERYISNLASALKSNKPFLEERSIETLNKAIQSNYRIIAANICPFKEVSHSLDFGNAITCIKNNIKAEKNGTLDMRLGTADKFWDNRIHFLIKEDSYPEFGTPEFLNYRLLTINLEYECEAEFWSATPNEELYSSIANFNCFDDVIKPIDEYQKYLHNDFIYNVKGWKEYVFQAFGTIFKDYRFDDSRSGSTLRFLKPLNEELFFGFEYQKSDSRNLLPDTISLIVLNKKFDKKTKSENYYSKHHPNILALGILGSPFFYKPCMPMTGYSEVAMMNDIADLTMAKGPKYKPTFGDMGDRTIKVEHPKEYGELLKRHAFYYLSALEFSAKGYLDYLEKSIVDAIPTHS